MFLILIFGRDYFVAEGFCLVCFQAQEISTTGAMVIDLYIIFHFKLVYLIQ